MKVALAPRLVASAPDIPAGAAKDGPAGRILTAALGLFAQRGMYGTSIRDIASAVGLRSASLYGHFPSKEHLLADLVLIGHEEHHSRIRTALLDTPPDPPEQLTAFVRAHVRFHADFPVLAIVANNELHAVPPDLAAPALALRQQSELLLVELVERGIDKGEFEPPHAWMAAAAIGGMGIRVANWYEPGLGFTPDEVAETYADLALRMVRPAASTAPDRATRPTPSTSEVLARRGLR